MQSLMPLAAGMIMCGLAVYEQLLHNTPKGSYLVSDTAFPQGTSRVSGKIKAPLKQGDHLSSTCFSGVSSWHLIGSFSHTTNSRVGMHALWGAFGRLRVPLDVVGGSPFPPAESSGMGSQLQTTRVGINQICSVYCNIWREGDGEEIWQGFASIMFGDLRKHDRVARFHTMAVEQDEE